MKKRYAFAGASGRAYGMFAKGILDHFSDVAEIAGVYDINIGRSEYFSKLTGAKVYADFEEMLNAEKPDAVIVTTVDAYHSDYIIRSMEMGYDVITEKPMTIDAERCQKILDTEKATGRKLTVTFNYRYSPYATRIKELLTEGVIGDIYSVHFEWSLDRSLVLSGHGASYYRRWNSVMEKSGGLLVHKSTHHFDMINWFLCDTPSRVSAFGKMNVYGPKNRPWSDCGKTCRECPHANECEFYYKMNETEVERYQKNEHLDGYYKDACVYRDEVNIYDTMAVLVEYRKGAMLSYSLNSTAAYEGWKMIINGSKGRLEAVNVETGIQSIRDTDVIRVFDLKNQITEYVLPRHVSGHGGGDIRLLKNIFVGNQPDPLGHAAGSFDGANSILIGALANKSIATGKIISVDDEIKF